MSKQQALGLVAEMYDQDRATVTRLMRNASSDLRDAGRTAAVENNVTDLEDRRRLFHDYMAESDTHEEKTTVVALTIFLLCPIDQLRHRVAAAQEQETFAAFAILPIVLNTASDVIRSFLSKARPAGTATSSAASTPMAAGVVVAQAGKQNAPVLSSPRTAPPMVVSPTGPSEPKRKATSPAEGSPAGKKLAQVPAPTTPPTAGSPGTPSSQSPSTKAKDKARRHSATAAAYRRDKHVCVLSGYGYPDGAHIFPFSASKDRKVTTAMLLLLETFWGQDKMAVWRAQCEDTAISDPPKNMICLGKHLHALWGAARFGLKPLRIPAAAEKNEPDDVVDDAMVDELVDQLAALMTSMSVASYGLNLHKCCADGVVLQFSWSYNAIHQATGRILRLGQTQPVSWTIIKTSSSFHCVQEAVLSAKWAMQLSASMALPDFVVGKWQCAHRIARLREWSSDEDEAAAEDTDYVPGGDKDDLNSDHDSDARFVRSELLPGSSQKGRRAPSASPSAIQIAANYRGASLVSLDLNYAALLARYRRRKGAFLGVSDATSIRQEEGGGGISWLFERTSTGGQGTHGGFAESSSGSDGNARGKNGTLAHRQSGICIETGQVFVISADRPEGLPSLDLLELQWNLVRVAAMSGAADAYANRRWRDDGSAGVGANEEQTFDELWEIDGLMAILSRCGWRRQ
ncbi:snf2 family helicase [Ophiostoma piceae UAMH 11346]|uniref:Snf2 family helicase n=1 Tax=Ophiostoma piceae (strain UAMH 11346) TaxID=1262450 RepID=S3CI82_OPHP1|nr:snf2 family helicase [Ophiostoma piceae UAMH 11346]